MNLKLKLHIKVLFLKVGQEHPELSKLVELTQQIKHKDEEVIFKNPLDINKLLPGILN